MLDHKDGDGLSNRWKNLREATQTQNNGNMKKRGGTSSVFKGVTFVGRRKEKKWQAQIKVHGQCHFLGRFLTEGEAAAAYMAKAEELFGEFARAA